MKLMIIQAAELDHEGCCQYSDKTWFDDLTIAYLAALTPKDIECIPVVERLDHVDFDADVDLVGITTMGVSPMLRAYQIADRFRKRGVPVFFGGVNFTLNYTEAKQHADSVVLGEAEPVWLQLIEDFKRGELKPFYQSELMENLSGLPIPRYDLFNKRPEFRGALFTVQAARGCPNRCDFCAIGAVNKGKIRFKPIDDVIRDIKATGSRRIFFADDNMMANPSYYKELYRRMIPLKIHWIGATTISIGNDADMLKLARKSGCVLFIIGIESISQGSLNSTHKGFNKVEEYGRMIKQIHEAGIIASCTTIFGFDEDDKGVFDRTVEFCMENKIRIAPFFLLTPVPGTATWKKLKSEGRIITDDYRLYDTVTSVFQPAKMSSCQLEDGLRYANKKLYTFRSASRRLFPLLGNPVSDLLAAVMNIQYIRLSRKGQFGSFNFN
jgi:radical SAM superfamily enzyme YgiQ (UPF0313 family)